LYREKILIKDFSSVIEHPQTYHLSTVPRSITWDEVRRMLDAIDKRSVRGKRDHAILLLLVTYGLRAREVAALTLDDIDWRNERLRIPERKAGHSTAYPLSPIVGAAVMDYLKMGRPQTTDRHISSERCSSSGDDILGDIGRRSTICGRRHSCLQSGITRFVTLVCSGLSMRMFPQSLRLCRAPCQLRHSLQQDRH
jgi:integrase